MILTSDKSNSLESPVTALDLTHTDHDQQLTTAVEPDSQQPQQQLTTVLLTKTTKTKEEASTVSMTNTDHVFVQTADGREHLHNRRHLAMESLYFRVLFSGIFADSHKLKINLDTDSSSWKQFVALLTVAREKVVPDMELEQAVKLLPVASFLCADLLLKLLSQVIIRQVSPQTIVEVFRRACNTYPSLARTLWNKLIKEFQIMFNTNEYLKMTSTELNCALEDECLNIQSQDECTVVNQYLVTNNPPPFDVMREKMCTTYEGDGRCYPVLKNRVPHDVAIVIGGWGISGATDVVETYNPRTGLWIDSKTSNIRMDQPRAYHGIAVTEQGFLVCGGMNGRDFFSDSSFFDLSAETWTSVRAMKERRCYLPVVSYVDSEGKTRFIAAGGYNGTSRVATCEMYEPEVDEWVTLPSMTKKRSDFSMVRLGDHLISIGGFDGRSIHNDLELFDINTGNWYGISAHLRSSRTGVSAVAVNESTVIIAGGYNGVNRLRSAEMFDIREGKCHVITSMHTTRSNFGMTCIGSKVHVAGGFDGSRTTALTEEYDIIAGRWQKTADLNAPKSALKIVHLSGHSLIHRLVNFKSSASVSTD